MTNQVTVIPSLLFRDKLCYPSVTSVLGISSKRYDNPLFFYKLGRKCIANEFQFVIIYYKLGRNCIANAFQFVIIYYKLGRKCIANAFQFVIIYYNLGRNCIANAYQFVIKKNIFKIKKTLTT